MLTLDELETFFATHPWPATLKINRSTAITDMAKFLDSHFATLRAHGITPTFRGFYDRLVEIKEILEKSQELN